MRHREVIISCQPLIDVAEHYIKPRLTQFHVDICVHKRIIATLYLSLVIETHGSGLIVDSLIFCVIIAINAKLHIQYLCNSEMQIEVGIYRKPGKRDYIVIRGLLIRDSVVPMKRSELEVLIKRGAEYLYAPTMLKFKIHDELK